MIRPNSIPIPKPPQSGTCLVAASLSYFIICTIMPPFGHISSFASTPRFSCYSWALSLPEVTGRKRTGKRSAATFQNLNFAFMPRGQEAKLTMYCRGDMYLSIQATRRTGLHSISHCCMEKTNRTCFSHLPHTSLVLSEGSLRRRCSCVRNSPASLTTEELLLRRNASHRVSRPWMPKKSCTTIWLCRGVKTSACGVPLIDRIMICCQSVK